MKFFDFHGRFQEKSNTTNICPKRGNTLEGVAIQKHEAKANFFFTAVSSKVDNGKFFAQLLNKAYKRLSYTT